VIVPEYSHVANAIGAGVGIVKSVVSIEITLHQNGMFLIHADDKVIRVESPTEALNQAKQIAIENVKRNVIEKGGKAVNETDFIIVIKRVDIPGMEGDVGLISAKVLAECEGLVI